MCHPTPTPLLLLILSLLSTALVDCVELTDTNIQGAVNGWIEDPTSAEELYGNIADW